MNNPSSMVANTVDLLIKPEEKVPETIPMVLKYTNSVSV